MPKYHAYIHTRRMEIIEKDDFKKYLKSKVGKTISLEIGVIRSRRSNKENRYYFGVLIPLISEHLGYTPKETHEILKALFLSVKKKAGKKEITISCSSASLTTVEFEKYLESIRTWAVGEFGIIIPLPQ